MMDIKQVDKFLPFTTPHALTTMLLVVTALVFPLSVSLKSIFMALASASILFDCYCDARAERLMRSTANFEKGPLKQVLLRPWFICGGLFFVMIVVGCFYSPASHHTQFDFVHKYSKLLFLPLLVLAFKDRQCCFWVIHAFLIGMLIAVCCSIASSLGVGHAVEAGAIFHNHIVTGYYMAFAAFVACVFAVRTTGRFRVSYLLMAILFNYHLLFINVGRTGYVLLAAFMLIFLLGFWRSRLTWLLILIPVLFVVLQGAVNYQNSVIKQRVESAISDVQNYQQQPNTPVGERLQFHHYAQQLFWRSPLWGVGTGAFSYYFDKENPVPAWGHELMEPHGEYWLVAAEHGLIGLLLFLSFILALFYESFWMTQMRIIFLGLLITFLLGCCSDGFLVLSRTGGFFLFFAAMGLGEALVERDSNNAKYPLAK